MRDICFAFDEGVINVRAGAIIMKDGKFLMVGNDKIDYLYSVGGRVKFGETAEQAVVREVYEETGVKMDIDRLGFIHENYFIGDDPKNNGRTVYEISLYFYMKVPDEFVPVSESFTEYDSKEHLRWVSPDDKEKIFPDFFKKELKNPVESVKHFVTDDR